MPAPLSITLAGVPITISDGRYVLDRPTVDVRRIGDYGADPLPSPDGTVTEWRMVPSGDICDRDEMRRRLDRKRI